MSVKWSSIMRESWATVLQGQISRSILNVNSVPGPRPSLSSCPGNTRCHGDQDGPASTLLELRTSFSRLHDLASSLSFGSLPRNTGLAIPVGCREQCVGLSSAVLASQKQSSTGVQWLLVRVAAGSNSCASATALRMVKKKKKKQI